MDTNELVADMLRTSLGYRPPRYRESPAEVREKHLILAIAALQTALGAARRDEKGCSIMFMEDALLHVRKAREAK